MTDLEAIDNIRRLAEVLPNEDLRKVLALFDKTTEERDAALARLALLDSDPEPSKARVRDSYERCLAALMERDAVLKLLGLEREAHRELLERIARRLDKPSAAPVADWCEVQDWVRLALRRTEPVKESEPAKEGEEPTRFSVEALKQSLRELFRQEVRDAAAGLLNWCPNDAAGPEDAEEQYFARLRPLEQLLGVEYPEDEDSDSVTAPEAPPLSELAMKVGALAVIDTKRDAK